MTRRRSNRTPSRAGTGCVAALSGLVCLVLVVVASLIIRGIGLPGGQAVLEWGLCLVVVVPAGVYLVLNGGSR